MSRNAGCNREADGEIETGEVERSANNEIRDLGYGLSTDKSKPMVGFGLEKISHFSHYDPKVGPWINKDTPSFHVSRRYHDWPRKRVASD
jgi:hypothetical protein